MLLEEKNYWVIYPSGIKKSVKFFWSLSVRTKPDQLRQVTLLAMLTGMRVKSMTLKNAVNLLVESV